MAYYPQSTDEQIETQGGQITFPGQTAIRWQDHDVLSSQAPSTCCTVQKPSQEGTACGPVHIHLGPPLPKKYAIRLTSVWRKRGREPKKGLL